MANSVTLDQTAQEQAEEQSDLGLHCLHRSVCLSIQGKF